MINNLTFTLATLATVTMLSSLSVHGQDKPGSGEQQKYSKSVYDSALAKKLGADEYGMRQYVLAFLKRGPNRGQDSSTAARLQKAHMENIGRMANEGKLVLAGPFLGDGELRGLYVFNVTTIEEARKLTETDPAVQAGRLVMELHPWYGSAAMQELNALHEKIAKDNP